MAWRTNARSWFANRRIRLSRKRKKGGILPPFFIEHPYPSCAQLTSMSAILAVPCEALPVHEASLAKPGIRWRPPERGESSPKAGFFRKILCCQRIGSNLGLEEGIFREIFPWFSYAFVRDVLHEAGTIGEPIGGARRFYIPARVFTDPSRQPVLVFV